MASFRGAGAGNPKNIFLPKGNKGVWQPYWFIISYLISGLGKADLDGRRRAALVNTDLIYYVHSLLEVSPGKTAIST